jgi:site-specific recombinase XerD
MLKNLEHYVQVLKIEKNHSANTVNSYLSDIKSFENFLKKRKISFKKVINNSEVIKNYFRYLSRSKISPRSIKRKYSSLSSYFSYLIDRKEIKKNPLNSIFTPKLTKKTPYCFIAR